MKIFLILALGALSCISAEGPQCSPSSKPSAGELSDAEFWEGVDGAQFITELDDESHEQFTQDNPKAFVMYYTTWCGYSKQARSGYAGAAKKLNGKVSFGAVDCDKAPNSCQGEHAVEGYPTFYLYKSGAWNDRYQGQRTTKAFVNYLSKK